MQQGFAGRISNNRLQLDDGKSSTANCATGLGCAVVWAGLLTERAMLCRKLGVLPDQALSNADLVALAYRRWGSGLQRHVLGQYAAVVLDCGSGRGLLFADIMGLRTLFYAVRGTDIWFATRLADVLDPVCAERPNMEYLSDYIALGYQSTELTPFDGVRRLLPGCVVLWDGHRPTARRTWSADSIRHDELAPGVEGEAQFRNQARRAVSAYLEGHDAPCVSLSGGLDSSTVSCVAALERPGRISAMTLVCPSFPEADETRWARQVVDHTGGSWWRNDVDAVLPFRDPPGEVTPEPTLSLIDAARLRAEDERLTAEGIDLLMTGDGGDILLRAWSGSAPVHLGDYLLRGQLTRAARELTGWTSHYGQDRPWLFWAWHAVLTPIARHWRGQRVRSAPALALPPWLDQGFARAADLSSRLDRRPSPRCKSPGIQNMTDALWCGAVTIASSGVHERPYTVASPLFHLPFVEFMLGVPWYRAQRPDCDRLLQRQALAGILPENVRRRATKGAGSFSMVRGLQQSPQWVDYLSTNVHLADLGVVDVAAWRNAIRQASAGQLHGDRYFLTGVLIEVWLRGLARLRGDILAASRRPIDWRTLE